ncbi:Sporulation related domain protein [Gilliamella apicola SCGC AB-598-I20]|nr:Sporulation related domain protein [Gilliamella apicola SCGC AB-598-I20]
METNRKKTKIAVNKVRNQLVGFATFLLVVAIVAPIIITDKSNLHPSTTPILQPEVVNEQNQDIIAKNESVINRSSNNGSEQLYTPDSSQYTSPLATPESVDGNFDSPSTPNTLTNPEQSDKTYMIQLGALKNKRKIEELVALLRLNNYNVSIIPSNPGQDQLIKLQVGPYAKKEQAEQLISDLNNLTKLKGVIVTN